jgi:hypothetical protein
LFYILLEKIGLFAKVIIYQVVIYSKNVQIYTSAGHHLFFALLAHTTIPGNNQELLLHFCAGAVTDLLKLCDDVPVLKLVSLRSATVDSICLQPTESHKQKHK